MLKYQTAESSALSPADVLELFAKSIVYDKSVIGQMGKAQCRLLRRLLVRIPNTNVRQYDVFSSTSSYVAA